MTYSLPVPELTIVVSPVLTSLQVGGEGFLLVILHPVGGAAVIVVGVHVVVVHVQA